LSCEEAQGWPGRAVEVLRRPGGGPVNVQWWFGGSLVVTWVWYGDGSMMVRWWSHRGPEWPMCGLTVVQVWFGSGPAGWWFGIA
jgi:hypothetical protein